MNSNMKTNSMRYGLGAGLLLCTAVAASAAGNSLVTFSVDMTGQIQKGVFTPGTTHVYARGSFNNWSTGAYYDGSGSSELTNNAGAAGLAANVYTGTFADTNDANGALLNYKYYMNPGDTWENDIGNRTFGLPTAAGGQLALPTYYFDDQVPTNLVSVTNSITFQVDMTTQIQLGNFNPGTDTVAARGSFNNWGNDNTPTSPFPLTNNPAAANTNLYTGVFLGPTGAEGGQIDNPDSPQHFKYWISTGSGVYESVPPQSTDSTGNRVYNLLDSNGSVVLPPVFFNDLEHPITNNVTFRVDMTFQIQLGRFVPPPSGIDYVEARGAFNNWNGGFTLTNNPAAVGTETNVYSGTWSVIGSPSGTTQYKFWSLSFPGNYETPPSTGGGNRSFLLLNTNGDLVLPDVFFDDQQLGDITPNDTVVTFSVNMTNAVGTDGHAFDPTTDGVYVNGDFLGWWGWGIFPPPAYQLLNSPVGSSNYVLQLTIPAGSPLALTYKYSINGTDNEAGFAQNHVRYIRAGTSYAFPMDKFGNQYAEPGTGNVTIGAPSGGHALVSWLGHPGIYLQTSYSLTGGSWQDLPWTDGINWSSGYVSTNGFVSTTNYPTSGGQTYFRWVKPSVSPAP
jgi:hypothetical protein